MAQFNRPDHKLLVMLLEAAAIRKRTESKFSPTVYKVFQGFFWLSFSILILNCGMYLAVEEGDKMMTVAIISMTIQSLLYNVLLARKSDQLTSMIQRSEKILANLEMDDSTVQELQIAENKSKQFLRFFAPLVGSNIVMAVAQASMKMRTAEPTYPFAESCLGLSTVPCWFLQIITTSQVSYFVVLYFSTIKVIIYRMSAYYKIISKKFKERAVQDDEIADKKLFSLFTDISRFTIQFSQIFGVTAFVEVALVAVRNSFQSYHVMMSISQSEWGLAGQAIVGLISSNIFPYLICSCGEELVKFNTLLNDGLRESKWYESSTSARKRLLPVFMFANNPIRFTYGNFVVFNMERFTQVMRATHSLITAIANFI